MLKIRKHSFPIFFAFLLLSNCVLGQKNEIGASIGGFSYRGEVSPSYNILHTRPSGSIFYRMNLSPAVALKGTLGMGAMHASEKNVQDPIPKARQAFHSGMMSTLEAAIEYNFFNYRSKKDPRRLSPFLTTGLAVYNYKRTAGNTLSNKNSPKLSIPMGVGFKYQLSKQWNLGLDLIAHKTFTDNMDGITTGVINNRNTGNPNDKDWYYHSGISISYTFYAVECPKCFYK